MTETATPRPADMPSLRIVPFTAAHLTGAWCLSQQARWPHRPADWEMNLSLSQGVVALDGETVVGTALATRFGSVALLNMIIVDARLRGRGLGRRLMAAAMDLADGGEMRLVATSEGLPLYQGMGFVATGKVAQHQGIAVDAQPELPVETGRLDDLDRLAEMDLAASGMDRADLLRRIAEAGEVLRAEGGFALLRPFGRGRVVGPVVAGDVATARTLIAEAARRSAGTYLRIDLPEERGLGAFAASLGMAQAGGGIAMARNAEPAAPGPFTSYALASQALG